MGSLISRNPFISLVTTGFKKNKAGKGPDTVISRKITCGTNVIPDNEMEILSEHPFVKGMVKLGKSNPTKGYNIIDTSAEIDMPVDDTTVSNEKKAALELAALHFKEAKQLILGTNPTGEESNGILDIAVLKEILETDNRVTVISAAKQQIDLLYARDEEEEEA